MLKLTDDDTVNALIMDNIEEGELYGDSLYGENWENYKANVDSMSPDSELNHSL